MLKELLESAKANSLSSALIADFEIIIDFEEANWPKASVELLEDCRGEAMMNLVSRALKFHPAKMLTEDDAIYWIRCIVRESYTNVISKWNRG